MQHAWTMPTAAGVALVCLALVHVFAGKLRFLQAIPRSRWLSLAGGASVAYVFVHLLPELAAAQREHGRRLPVDSAAYLLALAGLTAFYGLERFAKRNRDGQDEPAAPGVFWLHVASFSLYNAIVGYLLIADHELRGDALLPYGLAMALHFVVNDHGLWSHHRERYTTVGRWTLATAILVGGLVGAVAEVPRPVVAALVALLAGGIVLNVLKEELPDERQSRFVPFVAGAAGITALLLAV